MSAREREKKPRGETLQVRHSESDIWQKDRTQLASNDAAELPRA